MRYDVQDFHVWRDRRKFKNVKTKRVHSTKLLHSQLLQVSHKATEAVVQKFWLFGGGEMAPFVHFVDLCHIEN